jgi:hypothetical protein
MIRDEIVPAEMLYPDGKTYEEDETYAVRFKLATEDGIVREYGRRRSDNKIVVLNIQEIQEALKEKSGKQTTGIV